MTDQIVRLNIGGYKYQTTRSTLASRGENFFTKLLEGKIGSVKDEEGYYFIDRDGQYFQPILSFLRTGLLTLPDGMPTSLVDVEANFYLINIHPNVEFLSEPMAPMDMQSLNIRHDGFYWDTSEQSFIATIFKPKSTAQFYGVFQEQRSTFKAVNQTTLEVQISRRHFGDTIKTWIVLLAGGEAINCYCDRKWRRMNFYPSLPPVPNNSYGHGYLNLSFSSEDEIKITRYEVCAPIQPKRKTTSGGIIKYSFKLDDQYDDFKGSYTIYSFGIVLISEIHGKSGIQKQLMMLDEK